MDIVPVRCSSRHAETVTFAVVKIVQVPVLPRPRRFDLDDRSVPAVPPRVRHDPRLGREAFRVSISEGAVEIVAGGQAGEFYANDTLEQLAGAFSGRLPTGTIDDEPALGQRGVMLDVSRSRVPTMATLYAMVDRLARWRINHLELYLEHTFAYVGHETVWEGKDPFSETEIGALRVYCAARHITLVANQNTLGHFERWLAHPRYRPLAARPEGFLGPDGEWRAPSTLDPNNPDARALVASLIEQLVSVLPSEEVNIGLDEPWELISGREQEWLAWLEWLAALPVLKDKRLLCWGDVPARHPELIGALPDQVVVCEWGYEADHPFTERSAALAGADRRFWCCPGTSSWNSVAGRLDNALGNCDVAARAALEFGGEGFLVTDWGDGACQQYLPFIEVPLALGAAAAWSGASPTGDLGPLIGRRVFADPSGTMGAAVVILANAYQVMGVQMKNASILTRLLFAPADPVAPPRYAGVSAQGFEAALEAIEEARAELASQRSAREDATLMVEEIEAAAEVLVLCAHDGLARLSGDGTLAGMAGRDRVRLAAHATRAATRHQGLWLARNRPGGLEESLVPLRRYAATLEATMR